MGARPFLVAWLLVTGACRRDAAPPPPAPVPAAPGAQAPRGACVPGFKGTLADVEGVPMHQRAPRVLVALADGCGNLLGDLAAAARAASDLAPRQRDDALARAARPHETTAGCSTRTTGDGQTLLRCSSLEVLGVADQALRELPHGAHAFIASVVHRIDTAGGMDASAVRLAETFILASAMEAGAGR